MDSAAWARLVEVFSPIVYRWARTSSLSAADSADVVQDVFVAVARNISRFERKKSNASFRSWLATIARNRIRDSFRKQTKHAKASGGTAALERLHNIPEPVLPSAPSQDIEKSISLAGLNKMIPARLLEIIKKDCDDKTCQAFWLTTVCGDKAADVADRLGLKVASVYQVKSRILRRLRAKMAEIPD